ncbi:MAG: response regulator, partial [Bacteroidales bacterium]|nr:response regulator [Bacteroidales bacterium]
NDILDFSKIESGQLEFENIPFSLETILQTVIRLLSFKAKSKKLELKYSFINEVPIKLSGDPVRLKQIIINLVNNAIKFTKSGHVIINVRVKDEDSDTALLLFEIEDTGIGIAEEAIPKLFKSFSQANLATSRKFGGTGLGLAISKELSRLMNGEIGLRSTLGEGSCFWFTARLKKQSQKEIDDADKKDKSLKNSGKQARKLYILLAEDNPINQRVAQINLNNLGHEIVITKNGVECVEKYKSEKFDLILMDIQMPEMDGIEATKIIRELEQSGHTSIRTPIVALTANALTGDKERFLEAGMDAHLAKPFKPDGLKKVFENLIPDYYEE